METEQIRADVVEVQEFPYLGQSYRVQAVPKTVINNTLEVLGAVREQVLLQKVLTAVGREDLLEVAKVPHSEAPASGPTSALTRPR